MSHTLPVQMICWILPAQSKGPRGKVRSVGWKGDPREERAELTGHLDEHHHRARAKVSYQFSISLCTIPMTHKQTLELCWQVCHPSWDVEIADNEHEHSDGGERRASVGRDEVSDLGWLLGRWRLYVWGYVKLR